MEFFGPFVRSQSIHTYIHYITYHNRIASSEKLFLAHNMCHHRNPRPHSRRIELCILQNCTRFYIGKTVSALSRIYENRSPSRSKKISLTYDSQDTVRKVLRTRGFSSASLCLLACYSFLMGACLWKFKNEMVPHCVRLAAYLKLASLVPGK